MPINWGSTWRGIKAMRFPNAKVNYWARLERFKGMNIWCDIWTPVWHEGRGPYITMGFLFIAFYRSY